MNKRVLMKNRLLTALLACCFLLAIAMGMLSLSPKASAADAIQIWDGSVATTFHGGDGTQSSPFLIADGTELALLSQVINDKSKSLTVGGNIFDNTALRNAHYKLTANIKLNDTANWQSWTESSRPANTFKAIGYIQTSPTTETLYFQGVFDGDNHTIAGLYNVGTGSGNPVGLFGLIYEADIKNVGVIESSIFGKNMMGAIASYVYFTDDTGGGSTITNCFNTGNVTGTDIQVGGLIGSANKIVIENCYNKGTIKSGGSVGGIAASTFRKTQIKNCYNEGKIVSTGFGAGGIVGTGELNLKIEDSYNKGEITAKGTVGGIMGTYGNSTTTPDVTIIKNCYNTGKILKTGGIGDPRGAGGIVGGSTGNLTVDRCYNTAEVSNINGNYAGGIVGENSVKVDANSISNCYNTGNVISNEAGLGGIAANNISGSTIFNCFNTGEIIGAAHMTGGIVGLNMSSSLENCYNAGSVRVRTSQTLVGGVIGEARNDSTKIKNNYYLSGNTYINSILSNQGIGAISDSDNVVTKFDASNNGSNGGKDGDGTFTSAITVDSVSDITSLLAALNAHAEAENAVTAGKYNTWYQGKTLSSYPDFNAATIFTMTFNANGGDDGTAMANQAFTDGIAQNIAANTFKKTGYKFSGWNTVAAGGGTAYADKASVTLTEHTTLYAQWTPLAEFSLTFNANGGTGAMTAQKFYEDAAQSLSSNTFVRTGYKFNGWNTIAAGGGTAYIDGASVTLTSNLTLYAQWIKLAEYQITFDANGGTGVMTAQTFYEESAQSLSSNTFLRTGYKFNGWNTIAVGGGTAYTDGESLTLTGNLTLYAQWTQLTAYTVTFDANGGTGAMTAQTFYEDTQDTITANTFRKNWYKFIGWNTVAGGGGTSYTDAEAVTLSGNLTLYAQWELLEQYNLTYNANGGVGVMADQIFIEGSAQAILACTFTKEGYGFIGWNTLPSGGGTSYAVGQSVTFSSDMTLYAQWKTVFVVSFDSNNGTGTMDSQTFLEAIEQAIAGNGFTREGYTFKGWNTAADGSGTTYTNEEVLTLTSSIKLYAQWEKVSINVQDACNFHWFIFAWIALYMIISLLFTFLFKKSKLLHIIPWGAYLLGLVISAFFCRCMQCWSLWIIGVIFAVIAALLFVFIRKNNRPDPNQGVPPPTDESAEDEVLEAPLQAVEEAKEPSTPQAMASFEPNSKTLEQYLAEERENTETAEDALEYLTQEKAAEQKLMAKGEGEALRLQALEILLAELEEEERKGREKLNRLKEERHFAETKADEQKTSTLAVVESQLAVEKDEERKGFLSALKKELLQEEADKKLAQLDSEGEDLPTQTELSQVNAQREEARQKYMQAKLSGAAVVIPIAFRLSREDVLDFMSRCKQRYSCSPKDFAVFEKDFDESEQYYPVETNIKARTSPKTVDSLRCGDWCFSMMYERKDVIKFIMRMDDNYAEKLQAEHTGIKRSLFPKGENWYDVIIDGSYSGKKEIFDILYHCYVYVLNHYYELKDSVCITDTEAALKDEKTVASQVKDNENTVDPELEAVIEEKREAERLYFKSKMPIEMSRRRLLNYVQSSQPKAAEIVERERLSSPSSLKINGKTYAMVYQAKTMVRMIVKLDDDYAQTLSLIHPLIRRAKFPRGANWYIVEIDSSYTSTRQVYTMLTKSRNFVIGASKKSAQK